MSALELFAAPTRQTGNALKTVLALVSLMRSRRALAHLDATQLADIGLDAKTAHAEAQRPLWDVPQNWRS